MDAKAFQRYLATGEYTPTEDAAPASLAAHDKRFHPEGFNPDKDSCKFRESLAKVDEVDSIRGGDVLEEDLEYLDAVKRGDMETAAKMVNNAARKAGYKKLVYHGTPTGGFTEFHTLPAYVSEKKEIADIYQSASASSIRFGKQTKNPETKALYMNQNGMFDTRRSGARRRFLNDYVQGGEEWTPVSGLYTNLTKKGIPDWTEGESLADYIRAKRLKYDGIVLDEGGLPNEDGTVFDRGISYAVLNPRSLKSADAVTYDDDGNVIPLSKRFSSDSKDIRF